MIGIVQGDFSMGFHAYVPVLVLVAWAAFILSSGVDSRKGGMYLGDFCAG